MIENELSLTNQVSVPRLELGRNLMEQPKIEEIGKLPRKKEEPKPKSEEKKKEEPKPKEKVKKSPPIRQKPAESSTSSIKPEHLRAAKEILEKPETETKWDDLNIDVKRAVIELIKEGKYPARGPGGMGGGAGGGGGPVDVRAEERARFERELTEFHDIFNDPAVLAELRNSNPNLHSDLPHIRRLREFMERLDISKDEFRYIAGYFASLNTEIHGPLRTTAENWVSENSRRLLFEWAYEKIIGRPDDGFEEAPYSVGSLQIQYILDELNTLAVSEFKELLPGDTEHFYTYISKLQHMRMIMHELNRELHYGDQYKEFVTKNLRTSGLNFVQNDLCGVASVVRLYEKLAAQKVSQKKYWLNHGDMQEIEEEVGRVFRGVRIERDDRRLSPWEEERALRLGKILFKGTQRMALYAAMGQIPPMVATPDRIGSLPYEYIARALVPFKMIAARFFMGDKGGPKEFLTWVLKFQKEQEENFIDLFGVNKREMMLNSYGAFDAQSHSWRSLLMFFGSIRLARGDSIQTLLDYVQRESENFETTPGDPLLGGGEIKGKIGGRDAKVVYSERIRNAILGQRLYLSALQRYGNLSEGLKTDVWKKIAILRPSTIASIDPRVLEGEAAWETLKGKLFLAEEKRVLRDGERYNDKSRPLDDTYLNREIADFERARTTASSEIAWTDTEFNSVLRYMGMDRDLTELTPAEKTLLEKIVKHGIRRSKEFAKAKMPFNFVIDDTAKIAWSKTGEGMAGLEDEDILRILISDQKSFTEAWGEMNSFVESPTEKAVEHISKAVEGIGNVIGRDPAQKIIEPFILAYMKMAETYEHVVWLPGGKTVMRGLRKPTSIMEKYYRNSYRSLDEEEKAAFLDALNQAKAVSDNTANPREAMLTQLDYLKSKTGSSRLRVMLAFARTIIYILGPVAGYELLKAIIPTPKH